METIERYLTNVRVLLPAAQRESITAELREAVMTLRDEEESELGRALTPEEDERLLQELGHPVVVAAQYRRQQYLIGPQLYPVYMLTLKLVLAIIVIVAGICAAITATIANGAAGFAVGKVLSIAWIDALTAGCGITMMFAALQYHSPQLEFLNNRRAGGLAEPGKSRVAAWFDHIASLVIAGVLCCWRFGKSKEVTWHR